MTLKRFSPGICNDGTAGIFLDKKGNWLDAEEVETLLEELHKKLEQAQECLLDLGVVNCEQTTQGGNQGLRHVTEALSMCVSGLAGKDQEKVLVSEQNKTDKTRDPTRKLLVKNKLTFIG
jgi:hypothetical protein